MAGGTSPRRSRVAILGLFVACAPSAPLELELAGVLPSGTRSVVVAVERPDDDVDVSIEAFAIGDATRVLPFVDGFGATSSLVVTVAAYDEPLAALQLPEGPLPVYEGAGRSRALPTPDVVFSRAVRLDAEGTWTRGSIEGSTLDGRRLSDTRACPELEVEGGPLTGVSTDLVELVPLDATRVLLFAVTPPRVFLLELPGGTVTPLSTPNVEFMAGTPAGEGRAFLGSATIDGRHEAALYVGEVRDATLALTPLDAPPLLGAMYRALTATPGLRGGQRIVGISGLGELTTFETASRVSTSFRPSTTTTLTQDRAAGLLKMPPDAIFGEVWVWTDHAPGRVFAVPSSSAVTGPNQSPVREQTYGAVPEGARALGSLRRAVLLSTGSTLYLRGAVTLEFRVLDGAPIETFDVAAIVELPEYGALFVSNRGSLTLLDAESTRFCPSIAPTSASYVDAVPLPDGSALAVTRMVRPDRPPEWFRVRAR